MGHQVYHVLTIAEEPVDLLGGGVGANWSIHIVASWCNESITLPLASFSAYTRAYSSATLCPWAVAKFNSSLYLLMMANMFVSVSHNRWDKLLFDLRQVFNSSFRTMPSNRDWSLSSLQSLSLLLLPHRAPQNLFRPCSSLRALLVSCSKALVMAMLMSLSSAFPFRILTVADLNFSFPVWALSSFVLRACTCSSSFGASPSTTLVVLKFGSQSRPCA